MDETKSALPLATLASTEPGVSGQQNRFAFVIGALLLLWGAVLTPFANNPWYPVPGYLTAFGAAMFVTNVLLAALLFNRGVAERSAATVKLGSAYLYVAAIFLPLLAVFPGAFIPGNIIGEPVSALWIWIFWHAGFAVLILRYAVAIHRDAAGQRPRRPWPAREFVGVVAGVVVLACIGTLGLPWLPALFTNGRTFFEGPMQLIAWGVLGVNVAALYSMMRIRNKTSEQLWLAVGMIAACLDVWLTFHGTNRFSVGWYLAKVGSLFTSMVVLMSLFVDLTSLYRRVTQANTLLAQLASRDGLTGLANRRIFDEQLETEWRRAQRLQLPVALLMVDIDHFKLYNDTYGHLGGDDCLRKVAKAIALQVARPGDLAARYGGEEFAVILPNTSATGARSLAADIRDSVAALGLVHTRSGVQRVSVSVGVAVMWPTQTLQPSALVSLADTALYQAKELGRDRVHLADDPGARDPAPQDGVPALLATGQPV